MSQLPISNPSTRYRGKKGKEIVQPTLSLTYPDYQANKVKLLAVTHSRKAMLAFKTAVLEEARLNLLGCDDEVLKIEYGQELRKLEALLGLLIPDNGAAGE
jgi:hypothetical protein